MSAAYAAEPRVDLASCGALYLLCDLSKWAWALRCSSPRSRYEDHVHGAEPLLWQFRRRQQSAWVKVTCALPVLQSLGSLPSGLEEEPGSLCLVDPGGWPGEGRTRPLSTSEFVCASSPCLSFGGLEDSPPQ